MPEDRNRELKAIVAKDPDQYDMLKAIKDIDPIYLNPWGRLPDIPHPETERFVWRRRTPENIWPVVWVCTLLTPNASALTVVGSVVSTWVVGTYYLR
jgi:hypothetical protein